MKPRPTIRERLAAYPAAGLLLALLAPLVMVLVSAPAQAAEPTQLCVPSDTAACIVGTIRSEEDTVADVDIIITAPSGGETTVTTDDSGKWSYQAQEAGEYQVALDQESLPEDITARGRAEKTVNVQLGADVKQKSFVALFEVRTGEFDASTSKTDLLIQSAFNGLRLGLLLALASVGLSLIYGTTGLSNFAHAEQVGLGGILAYALRQRGRAGPLDRQHPRHHRVRVHRLRPGPRHVAAAAPPGARHHPDDDRDHRTFPRRCSTPSSTSSARARCRS